VSSTDADTLADQPVVVMSSTVAVLRLVMPVLQWGFVRHAA
jgi:hypothetical protein